MHEDRPSVGSEIKKRFEPHPEVFKRKFREELEEWHQKILADDFDFEELPRWALWNHGEFIQQGRERISKKRTEEHDERFRELIRDELNPEVIWKLRYPTLLDLLGCTIEDVVSYIDGEIGHVYDQEKIAYVLHGASRSQFQIHQENGLAALLKIYSIEGISPFPAFFDIRMLSRAVGKRIDPVLDALGSAPSERLVEFLKGNKFLEEYFQRNPDRAVAMFIVSHSSAVLRLFDSQIMRNFLRENLDQIVKQFPESYPEIELLLSYYDLNELVDLNLRAKKGLILNALEEETNDTFLEKLRAAFRKEFFVNLAATEEEYLMHIFDSYGEEALRSRDEDSSQTVGIEIELFNLTNPEFEIRPPITSQNGAVPFCTFLFKLSKFLYEKIREIKKEKETSQIDFPYSNLHISFSLSREQKPRANYFFEVLEDITYCYSLAYSPISRVSYLEHDVHGTTRAASVDLDFIQLSPMHVGRFQTRFFSIGGNAKEIASSIHGVRHVFFLVPNLLFDTERLQRARDFLRQSTELQNATLELKWLLEEREIIEEKRKGTGEGVKSKEEMDQENLDLRFRFREVQVELQAILTNFFGNLESTIVT